MLQTCTTQETASDQTKAKEAEYSNAFTLWDFVWLENN